MTLSLQETCLVLLGRKKDISPTYGDFWVAVDAFAGDCYTSIAGQYEALEADIDIAIGLEQEVLGSDESGTFEIGSEPSRPYPTTNRP